MSQTSSKAGELSHQDTASAPLAPGRGDVGNRPGLCDACFQVPIFFILLLQVGTTHAARCRREHVCVPSVPSLLGPPRSQSPPPQWLPPRRSFLWLHGDPQPLARKCAWNGSAFYFFINLARENEKTAHFTRPSRVALKHRRGRERSFCRFFFFLKMC